MIPDTCKQHQGPDLVKVERLYGLGIVFIEYEKPGPGVAKYMIKFRSSQAKVDGHKNGPQTGASQIEFDELGAIVKHGGHPVTFFNA
jgi:hypothetical protein